MSLSDLKETHESVKSYLLKEAALEQLTTYEQLATKSLLIAAAGDLEKKFNKLLVDIPKSFDSPEYLINFVETQAVKRKFHSMFDWSRSNINSFAGLFGPSKKNEILDEFKSDDTKPIIENFIFIGAQRNRIVHKGLATESLDNTFDEIWEKYLSASRIIGILSSVLLSQNEIIEDSLKSL